MTPTGPRSARRKIAHEAYQLRCMGRTWQEIADAKGFASAASVAKTVRRYIERMPAEDQATARALSAGNYRLILSQLHAIAAKAKVQDKPEAATRALLAAAEVQDKHDRLIGAHVPVAQRIDLTVTQTPAAVIDRAEAQLLELMASQPGAAPALEARQPAVLDAEIVEVDEA